VPVGTNQSGTYGVWVLFGFCSGFYFLRVEFADWFLVFFSLAVVDLLVEHQFECISYGCALDDVGVFS
jgi:hypothetical protein